MAKPYNLGDAEHILPQLGFLIQGLQLYPEMTVLDFGAGSCYASRILNQLGMKVTSMDVSSTALAIGRQLDKRWPPVGDVPEHTFPFLMEGNSICQMALLTELSAWTLFTMSRIQELFSGRWLAF